MNPLDREFVELLASGRLRCASEQHHEELARLRGVANPRAARRRRYRLVAAGLLRFADVPARPTLRLSGPLLVWSQGDPAPDFEALAYAAEARMREHALAPTRLYYATAKAVRTLGGLATGELPNPQQAAHDLCVTSVYLRLLADEPGVAALWRGEDELGPEFRERYRKVPDAFLCDGDGAPCVPVEFLGLYPPARIRAWHEDIAGRGFPFYEL